MFGIIVHICRETIRRAVVQKFNDAKGWDCENTDQLYDRIEDRQGADKIINSLKNTYYVDTGTGGQGDKLETLQPVKFGSGNVFSM